MADPQTLYRLLLKLYPARFREEYEKPLERQFLDEYNELQGNWRKAIFWIRALTDLTISIPAEMAHELRQDLRYAARVYRERAFTVSLALIAMALTIGVTTGIFSVVNAVLFRSLPFRDPDRLVRLQSLMGHGESAAVFHQWAAGRGYLSDAAGYRTEEMNLMAGGQAHRVTVAETSSNFFSLLGTEPLIGRAFAADEDVPGTNVAIASYGLWQQLGADPRILGSIIRVNGAPLTVIGIAPAGMEYPGKALIWTPTLFTPELLSRVHALFRFVDGRLKPEISLRRANGQYRAESTAQAKSLGISLDPDDLTQLRLVPLRDQLAGNIRRISLVLFGLVVFVLLTACANLAHLLLTRVTERRKELLLRAALGASRGRLVQQLITESIVLTLASAVGGLIVAQWVTRLASTIQPPSLTSQNYTVLDWPVLLFAVGIAILTGVLFGVLPAGLIRRMQPSMDPLRTAAGRNTGTRGLRAGLVAIQAALTVMLLAGAFTMSRSFLKITGTDLGLRTDHVVVMNVALAGTPRETHASAYYREALARLRAVPGVTAAGAVEFLPLGRNNIMAAFRYSVEGLNGQHSGVPVVTSPYYLRATGTALLDGRDFTAEEEAAASPVAIVNEDFARQFDPALHVVGKRLIPAFGDPMTIIGVARTQSYSASGGGFRMVYSFFGRSAAVNMTLVARVQGKAELYLPVCRDAVRGIDPNVPVYNVATLDERLREALSHPRFYTAMVLFFSGFTLLLALLGIHGVASFAIQQRAHEIGVRLAIGAQPKRLRASLVGEALLPVGGGLMAGVAAAVAFGRLLSNLMEGAESVGLPICAAAGAVLVSAAAIAVWMATRRIVRIDPMTVLRAS